MSKSFEWSGGFPHSDICGSMLVCQLPAAFRRLPRPSSPVIAKASTTCTLVLDPITLSPRDCSRRHQAPGLLQRLCCSHCHRRLNGNRRYIQSKPSLTTSRSQSRIADDAPMQQTPATMPPLTCNASGQITSSKLLKNKPPLALKKPEPSETPIRLVLASLTSHPPDAG